MAERAGVSPAAWAEMAKWRSRVGSSLAEAAVPALLQDLIRELHARSWVSSKGCERVIQLGQGTKPGDPLGDIIFLFAMRSALQRIRDDRRSRGRVWSVPIYPLESPVPLTSIRRDELGKPRFVDLSDVSYMDDATFPLVCDTAEQLASELPKLLDIVELVFAMKRFCLDFSCGKTEVIFLPRGPGKPRATATIAHDDGTYFELRDRRLRVVQDYVHVEGVVTASTTMTKVVRRQLQKTNGTHASLDTPIFAPSSITTKVKMGVAQSNLSAIVPPSQASMQQLSSFRAKVARRAINAWRQVGGTTDAQIREMLNLLAIPGVLRTLRLRQLAVLDANCHLPLEALLQAVDAKPLAWTESVAENLRKMHSQDLKLRQLPDPDEGPLAWRTVWKKFPAAWRTLTARAASAEPSAAELEVPQPVPCPECGIVFRPTRALEVHLSRRHGVRIPARRFVASPECPICHKDFRTRSRAIQHAHVSSIACRDALLGRGASIAFRSGAGARRARRGPSQDGTSIVCPRVGVIGRVLFVAWSLKRGKGRVAQSRLGEDCGRSEICDSTGPRCGRRRLRRDQCSGGLVS